MKIDPETPSLNTSIRPRNVICAADFPPRTKFFEIDDIPIADAPGKASVGCFIGLPRELSEITARKLGFEREISPEDFDACVEKSIKYAEEEDEQDAGEHFEDDYGNEDGYDPNCYAFCCGDSYPVGNLISSIRGLGERPDLSTETAEKPKVFLFAMERLPLVTLGVSMSLDLRYDMGGKSDWIEIRMASSTSAAAPGLMAMLIRKPSSRSLRTNGTAMPSSPLDSLNPSPNAPATFAVRSSSKTYPTNRSPHGISNRKTMSKATAIV